MKKQHQLCNLPKVSDFKVALKNLTPREADIGEKAQIYLQKSHIFQKKPKILKFRCQKIHEIFKFLQIGKKFDH